MGRCENVIALLRSPRRPVHSKITGILSQPASVQIPSLSHAGRQGIGVNQGILGKALDYGTIVVSGTGGTKEPFKNIAQPFEFRKQVQEQIAVTQDVK